VTASQLVAAHPPIDFGATIGATITLPDGTLESFSRRSANGHVSIFRTRSADNGCNWSEPEAIVHLTVESWGGPMPLLDRDGELHFVIPKVRGNGRKPAVDRFIDLWHLRSTGGRAKWSEPQRIFEGYCGSLQGVFQLKNGRIIAPFADWLPDVRTAPPTGPSVTTCVYSDDGGKTWRRSPAKLTAPCHDGYNGSNYGACEPTLIELKDGRVWMLIRTQDGFLYESFSTDGVDWLPAKRSRFHSSNSPAFPVRLPDGRIVVFWNNCEMCPRPGKDGVYSGRDALHAAISSDEGKTWRGFREVYRDATRNGSPPKDGDRGTAYPQATVTKDGKILLVSGQGADRRRRFLVDPEWLLETSQSENFLNLDAWHLFKGVGPAKRFWRDREQGSKLIPHPNKPGAKVLHIRDADGAVWNFPAARRGKLTLRLCAQKDFGGAQISLTDRMFEPCDDNGEKLAVFTLPIGRDGAMLKAGQWHSLGLAWDDKRCAVTLDGNPAGNLVSRTPASDGLSYLRLRSTAPTVDTAGFLVESVNVIAAEWEPIAPLPEPNGGMICYADGEDIIVAGGTNWENDTKHWLTKRWCFDSTWKPLSPLPAPLAYATVAGNFTAGGSDGQKSLDAILEWKADRPPRQLARLPHPVTLAGAGFAGDRLFVIGGTADIAELSTVTARCFEWRDGLKSLPDYPAGPTALVAVAAGKRSVFAFTGATWDVASKQVVNRNAAFAFDLAKRAWKPIRPYPFAARGVAAVPLDEKQIFLAGGYKNEGFTDESFIYNIASDRYEPGVRLPICGMVHLVKTREWLWVLGGEDRPKHRSAACWRIRLSELAR